MSMWKEIREGPSETRFKSHTQRGTADPPVPANTADGKGGTAVCRRCLECHTALPIAREFFLTG